MISRLCIVLIVVFIGVSAHAQKIIEKLKRKGVISLIGYVSGVFLAFVHTTISLLIFLAMAIMWLIPDRGIEKAIKHE